MARLLRSFAYVWGAVVVCLNAVVVAGAALKAESIWAFGAKIGEIFGPYNVGTYLIQLILISPIILALHWAKRLAGSSDQGGYPPEQNDDLERAILEVLNNGGWWMPSYIVGRLRERFDPAAVRTALAEMHGRRVIATHGQAYCLPENVEAIRAHHFKMLQSNYVTEQFEASQRDREAFDRAWRAVERWDGFGESEPFLGNFIEMPLRRQRDIGTPEPGT